MNARMTAYGLLTLSFVFARAAVGEDFKPGELTEHAITVDELARVYRVYTPSKPRKNMPLVFVLHGGGMGDRGARHVIDYVGMNDIAERERFVAVYPVGIDGNWNDGRGVAFIRAQKENIDDIKFLRTVVDEIAKSQSVDRSRIFTTGISNGAIMSHRLAAEASDLICAAAPVVGGLAKPLAKTFKPQYPVSIFVIQGAADPLVPIQGGEIGYKIGRKRGEIISTKEAVALYAKRNGCKGKIRSSTIADTDPDDGTTTSVGEFPSGIGGTKIQVHVVSGGGHTWPGKRQYLTERLVGKTSQDYDATEAIWKFFKSCPPRKLKK